MTLQKVRETIRRHTMTSPGQRVCVAVSGGPDSTALLLILNELKNELAISLSVCHINHQLRGEESDEDERFVIALTERQGLPCKVVAVDVRTYAHITGASTQTAGRELRYLAFRRIVARGLADKVATAHTAGDNAETLLLNLVRGAGPHGLSGIPPIREGIFIRPLLDTRKEELLAWLEEKGQPWRTDPSNTAQKYARNRVRTLLLPLIEKEFNPSAEHTLARTAEIFSDTQDYLSRQAEEVFATLFTQTSEGLEADRADFTALHPAIQRELVRVAVAKVRKGLAGISFAHLEEIRHLACGGMGGEIALPGITALTAHGKLYLRKTAFPAVPEFQYRLKIPCTVEIPEAQCAVTAELVGAPPAQFDPACETVYMDASAIPPTAVLRNRREGDTFHPLGAPGGRKLKKFLIDRKIPRWERDRLVLLADGNEVLWIAGVRLSEKVKVPVSAKTSLRLSLNR